MTDGWIKLHRKLLNNSLWTERRKFSRAEAWIDLLFMARWHPDPTTVLIDGRPIECRYGECLRSQRTLADRWGWSTSAVNRFLNLLQKLGQVTVVPETVTTRITIVNYSTYQQQQDGSGTHVERHIPSSGKKGAKSGTVTGTDLERASLYSDSSYGEQRNADGTQMERVWNADGTHVETEEEEKKVKTVKKKKKEVAKKATVVLPDSLDTDSFKKLWAEWVAYRKQSKKTLKPSTITRQLLKCEKIGLARAMAMIEHTIEMGWVGLREPDQQETQTGVTKNDQIQQKRRAAEYPDNHQPRIWRASDAMGADEAPAGPAEGGGVP